MSGAWLHRAALASRPRRRGDRMKRRDFITIVASATAWIATARAQEPRHVIGVLSALLKPTGSFDATLPGLMPAFYQRLGEAGFVGNMSIEYRWADGHYDRLPTLTADLVARNVSVIWATDVPSAFAA